MIRYDVRWYYVICDNCRLIDCFELKCEKGGEVEIHEHIAGGREEEWKRHEKWRRWIKMIKNSKFVLYTILHKKTEYKIKIYESADLTERETTYLKQRMYIHLITIYVVTRRKLKSMFWNRILSNRNTQNSIIW